MAVGIKPPISLQVEIADSIPVGFVNEPGASFDGFPFQYNVKLNVNPQIHGYVDASAIPAINNSYDQSHVAVGDWIAINPNTATQIIAITSIGSSDIDVIAEDIGYYNITSNTFNEGMPSVGFGFIFRIDDEDKAVIVPDVNGVLTPEGRGDINNRFQYTSSAQPTGISEASALSLIEGFGYITEASANTLFVNEGDLSAVSQFVNDAGYITEASAVALIAEISAADVSALSQLTNDVGYITEASAISLLASAGATQVEQTPLGGGEAIITAISGLGDIQHRTIIVAGAIELISTSTEIILSAAPNPTLLSELDNNVGFITELSALALIAEISAADVSALSQLTNDVGYITEASAQALVDAVEVTALSQLTDDIGVVTIDTATSVLSQLVNDAGYITEASALSLIAEISAADVSALSQLANDVGYITEVSADAAYVAQGDLSAVSQFVNDTGYITEASAVALVSDAEVSALSQLTNDVGYITEASANTAFVNEGDLSALSQFINDQGFVSAAQIESFGYITETSANDAFVAQGDLSAVSQFVNDAGYITEASAAALIAEISAADVSALSQLTNDVGYITEASAQALINTIEITETPTGGGEAIIVSISAGTEIIHRTISVNGAIQLSASPTEIVLSAAPNPTLLSELTNDVGYITEASANTLFVNEGDLSALSQFVNDQGFVSAAQIESFGFITETSANDAFVAQGDLSAVSQFVNDAGYITEASAQALVDANDVSALSQLTNDIGVVSAQQVEDAIDARGYITEVSADAAYIAQGDLSAVSQFTNDVGYITEASAQALVDAVEVSALSQLTDDIGVVTIDTATSVLSQLVNDAGYITEASANTAFVNEGDLSALSQFTNDVGYITEASALSLLASAGSTQVEQTPLGTGEAIITAISGLGDIQHKTIIGVGAISISSTSTEITLSAAINPTLLSELTNDVGYITEASANTAFVNEGDLSALSQFVNDVNFITEGSAQALVDANKVSALSQLTNDVGYITEISADAAYVAQGDLSAVSQFVNDAGYITEASAAALIAEISASDVSAISQLTDDVGIVTIDTATSVLSQLVNDAGYITEASANTAFVNEGDLSAVSQFVNDAGYITEASAVALIAEISAVFEVILSGNSVGTNFNATEFRTEFGNLDGEQITVSAENNVAVVTHYIPRLYSFRINAGADTAVDTLNPVSGVPTGWTLASARNTSVTFYHDVGRRFRQVTFHGFTNTNGYRAFGGSTVVNALSPTGFVTEQVRINIQTAVAGLSENSGHYIIELLF